MSRKITLKVCYTDKVQLSAKMPMAFRLRAALEEIGRVKVKMDTLLRMTVKV